MTGPVSLPASGSTNWYSHYQQLDRATRVKLQPESYGAVGDGTTDDTTALQNTLNAAAAPSLTGVGGVVQLSAKTYVTGPLTIPHSVTLQGVSRSATRLLLKAGSTDACLTFGSHTSLATIRDLRVDGNKGNQTSSSAHGIHFQTPVAYSSSTDEYNDPRNVVDNVHIEFCKGHGLFHEGRGANQITNLWVWLCDGNGVNAGGQDSFFANIDVGGSGLDGFLVNGADLAFLNCKAWFSGNVSTAGGVGNGWHISTFGGFKGSGLGGQDNARAGFYFDSCGRVAVNSLIADSNNTANLGAPGVDLSNAYSCIINGYSWDRGANTNHQQYALRVGTNSTGNRVELTGDGNTVGNLDPASVIVGNDLYVNGSLTPVNGVYNVVTGYSADKTGVADSGTAIQNAINAASSAGGGTVYLPAGVYLLNATLTMKSRVNLVGDGVAYGDGSVGTRLYQNSGTAACLTATDQRYMEVRNLTIVGTGGTTNTAVSFTRSSNPDIAGLRFSRVQITGFGTGMNLSNPITSTFDQVEIDSCTVGFYVHGVTGAGGSAGTSCAFLNCYANGCTQTGFRLDNMAYCSFTSCAADACGIGYELIEAGTQGIAFLGCGSESLVNTSSSYPGIAWKVNAAIGVSLVGCFTYNLLNNSVWVTGNGSASIVGFSENSPQAAVVNSIKVDTGSTATLENVTTVKPRSIAAASVLPDTQVFTASGTWTKPTGATMVHVEMIGGGNGGASGGQYASGTATSGGAGGGGGGYSAATFRASDLGATETVTVGGGGAGGAAITTATTAGNAGTAGTASQFGATARVRANAGFTQAGGGTTATPTAGTGGRGITTGVSGASAAVGVAGASGGIGPFAAGGGGSGGGITAAAAALAGGAGGTQTQQAEAAIAAGTAGGGAGAAGTSTSATNAAVGGGGGAGGGSSVTGLGGAGGNGGLYGGGGGGGGSSLNGNNSGAGGSGAPGIVVVTSW